MILCDRESDLAMDQERIIIRPRPGPSFMDSTAIDLRLDGTLDRWEFPAPKTGLVPHPSRSEGLMGKALDINPSSVHTYTTTVQHLLKGSEASPVTPAAAPGTPAPDTVSPV